MIRDDGELTMSFWTGVLQCLKDAPVGHKYHFELGLLKGNIERCKGDTILCSTQSEGFGARYTLTSFTEMLSEVKSGWLNFGPHPMYRFKLERDSMSCDKCGGKLEY